MNPASSTQQACAKVTTQLGKGDAIKVAGLGLFTVRAVRPYGSQALILLAWDNLAVITGRDVTWQPVIPGTRLYLHGYEPCHACDGKGITWR
jgi:hypothetical protein